MHLTAWPADVMAPFRDEVLIASKVGNRHDLPSGTPQLTPAAIVKAYDHAKADAPDVPLFIQGGAEAAGACGIQLEDQEFPKKCGHMLGRRVIDASEMAAKVRVAVESRSDPDFLVVARTDARTTLGLDEALRRAERYREAGADVLFVESPESPEEMRRIGERFRGVPLLANMVEGGRTPLLDASTLQELGYPVQATLGAEGGYRLAAGKAMPPFTMDALDALNAKNAAEWAGSSKSEVVALHRKNATAAAGIVRGIPDDDFERKAEIFSGRPPMSAGDLAGGILVGHVDQHLGSIRATTGRA